MIDAEDDEHNEKWRGRAMSDIRYVTMGCRFAVVKGKIMRNKRT